MDTKKEKDCQGSGPFGGETPPDPEIPPHGGSRRPAFSKRPLNFDFYL